jgi:predicted GIY-YIG superfamily endonuclease
MEKQKIIYVYEIINFMGSVEYVGQTKNLKLRFWQHKSKKGRFKNRQDIIINPIMVFDNFYDAYKKECEMQIFWDIETIDLNHRKKCGVKSGEISKKQNRLNKIKTPESIAKGGRIGGKISGGIAKKTGQIYELHKYIIESGLLKIARDKANKVKRKPIIAYDKNMNFVKEFISITEAANVLGVYQANISKVLLNKISQTGGYKFKYKVK